LPAGGDLTAVASRIEATQQAYQVAGSQRVLGTAEKPAHHFNEKSPEGLSGRKSFFPDVALRAKL